MLTNESSWPISHSFYTEAMATGYRIFKQGIQNCKYFCLKINIPKGNYWILRIGVGGRCQKVPKFDFQSQFSMSKIIRSFLNFFFFEEYQFRSSFFVIDIFRKKITLLLKWCPIFDSSPLHQFSKFKNFRWVCLFLGKNLSNFASPDLRLHNRYCHNGLTTCWL